MADRIRVLVLPRYERLGASSRLRMWQYLPWLEAAGVDVEVSPLLPNAYIDRLQQGSRSPLQLAVAYARQAARLLSRRPHDVVWIEKEVFPWMPSIVERAALSRDVPVVLDYDDAVYQQYEDHRSSAVRAMLREKHPSAMRGAALVIAGNATLAARAERAGARRVEIVPTVVDLDRYPAPRPKMASGEPPRVCWIGQRSTADLLLPYGPLFTSLAEETTLRFVAIGINAAAVGVPMESRPWSEGDEVAAISSCDIGIMPLPDRPFERGKCGYKLIQYMACGLPVVASPVGANREIVEHGVNGFLADTPEQWREALSSLAAEPELRARMGAAGRSKVERQYSLQVTGPKVASLIRSAATKRNPAP